jgi:hypothetical protein
MEAATVEIVDEAGDEAVLEAAGADVTETASTVLARLGRIEALDRAGASPPLLVAELRALLVEAEAWSRVEGGDAGERAVEHLRSTLARDMIAV